AALSSVGGLKVNGSGTERICNNINISIPGISSERLVIELDAAGICAASKSACREDADEESYVIAALRAAGEVQSSGGHTLQKAAAQEGSIRFTMGASTTKDDIVRTVRTLAS